jgi:hypothetical protein
MTRSTRDLPPPRNEFADKDEQDLYEAVERRELCSVGDLEARWAFWREVAESTVNGKRTRISLSIPDRDLSRIKA